MEKIDTLSLDLGEFWAMAKWRGSNLVDVTSFDGGKFCDYAWENTKQLLDEVEKYIKDYRVNVIVEKAHSKVPTQWVQYKDLKRLCNRYRINFIEYKTSHIKKVVTGNGRADKEDIMMAVSRGKYVGENFAARNEHEYDAVACGICFLEE